MFKIKQLVPLVFRGRSTSGKGASVPKTLKELSSQEIIWQQAERPRFSSLMYKNDDYTIEAGDFPEEGLYNMFYKNELIGTFDAWPKKWLTPTDEKVAEKGSALTPKK